MAQTCVPWAWSECVAWRAPVLSRKQVNADSAYSGNSQPDMSLSILTAGCHATAVWCANVQLSPELWGICQSGSVRKVVNPLPCHHVLPYPAGLQHILVMLQRCALVPVVPAPMMQNSQIAPNVLGECSKARCVCLEVHLQQSAYVCNCNCLGEL
jgi:hypothetical protein